MAVAAGTCVGRAVLAGADVNGAGVEAVAWTADGVGASDGAMAGAGVVSAIPYPQLIESAIAAAVSGRDGRNAAELSRREQARSARPTSGCAASDE